jgi:hypothetical protein
VVEVKSANLVPAKQVYVSQVVEIKVDKRRQRLTLPRTTAFAPFRHASCTQFVLEICSTTAFGDGSNQIYR